VTTAGPRRRNHDRHEPLAPPGSPRPGSTTSDATATELAAELLGDLVERHGIARTAAIVAELYPATYRLVELDLAETLEELGG
jgi:hypothetical protein